MPNNSGNTDQNTKTMEAPPANNTGAGASLPRLDQLKQRLDDAASRMARFRENQEVDPSTLYKPFTV